MDTWEAACSRAARVLKRRHPEGQIVTIFRRPWNGVIEVACWCELETMEVPTAVFRSGKTLSCGRPGCTEPRSKP